MVQTISNIGSKHIKTQEIEIEIPAEQSKKTGKLQNTSEPFGTIQYYPKILQLCSWVVYVGNLANSHREEEPWKEIRCHRIAANDHRRRPTQKEPTASMASQEFHLWGKRWKTLAHRQLWSFLILFDLMILHNFVYCYLIITKLPVKPDLGYRPTLVCDVVEWQFSQSLSRQGPAVVQV